NEFTKNLEAVYLTFNGQMTGIITGTPTGGMKGYFKKGGALIYSQGHNGKIVVWISYPYVEDLEEKPTEKHLANAEPSELTEPMILAHVEVFIKEITNHENQSRGKIG